MTPRDYILGLKAARPSQKLSMKDLSPELREIGAKSGLTPEKMLQQVNSQDFAEYLISLLTPRLPRSICDLFKAGWIVAGEIDDPAPQLYVERIDTTGYAIVLHSGLRSLIYRVARILSTRFWPMDDRADEHEHPGIEETARLVAEVFWWIQETGRAFGPSYPIRDHQIQIANLLALETEQFLIAHEIGHILDLESEHKNPVFLALDQNLDSEHREEHAADLFGVFLAMQLNDPRPKSDPHVAVTYAGIEFALEIYRALEVLGFPFKASHPTASSRLQVIRADMRRRCTTPETWQQLSTFAVGIDHLFDVMIRIIQNPGEHGEFFDRSAQAIVTELDGLLTECSGGVVPDYATFYTKAGAIFDRGYSHQLLERVAETATDFRTDVQRFSKNGGRPGHEASVRFQKFKLLFAFTREHMTEPARTLFLQAMDRVMN
jgi:hypothetical protein